MTSFDKFEHIVGKTKIEFIYLDPGFSYRSVQVQGDMHPAPQAC